MRESYAESGSSDHFKLKPEQPVDPVTGKPVNPDEYDGKVEELPTAQEYVTELLGEPGI